jgi:hypothetical protein
MSAAATAAGYLYASGRLRGRAAREQEETQQPERKPEKPVKKEIRVAIMPQRDEAARPPRKTPKIEYRTRKRWSPE